MVGKLLIPATPLLLAMAGLAVLLLLVQRSTAEERAPQTAAQTTATIGLDLKPDRNSAASLGAIDSCVSVDKGEAFGVDVYVKDVSDLLAWEVYFLYDRSRLEILTADVRLFLGDQSGSRVINVSDPLPSRSGLYRLAAADIATPSALETGSGVLARITLEAKENGVTPVSLPHLDFNDDLVYDLGPRLIGRGGTDIGDVDGDGLLDGLIDSARVAVGTSCAAAPEVSPTPFVLPETEGPSPDGGTSEPDGGTSEPGAETPGPDGQSSEPGNDPSTSSASSSEPGGNSNGSSSDGESGEGTDSGQEDGSDPATDTEDTPAGGSSDSGDGPRGKSGGGGSSLFRWIAASVGVVGILGLLLVLAALRQTRRHSNL